MLDGLERRPDGVTRAAYDPRDGMDVAIDIVAATHPTPPAAGITLVTVDHPHLARVRHLGGYRFDPTASGARTRRLIGRLGIPPRGRFVVRELDCLNQTDLMVLFYS